MNNPIFPFLILAATLAATLATPALAGSETGNGGDFVRKSLVAYGDAISADLGGDAAGRALRAEAKIDLKKLKSCVTVKKMRLVKGPIVDNGRSGVTARFVDGHMEFVEDFWTTLVFEGFAIDQMVMHELLRCTGTPDDDYVVSGRYVMSPAARRALAAKLETTRRAELSGERFNELRSDLLMRTVERYVKQEGFALNFGAEVIRISNSRHDVRHGLRGALLGLQASYQNLVGGGVPARQVALVDYYGARLGLDEALAAGLLRKEEHAQLVATLSGVAREVLGREPPPLEIDSARLTSIEASSAPTLYRSAYYVARELRASAARLEIIEAQRAAGDWSDEAQAFATGRLEKDWHAALKRLHSDLVANSNPWDDLPVRNRNDLEDAAVERHDRVYRGATRRELAKLRGWVKASRLIGDHERATLLTVIDRGIVELEQAYLAND